MASTSGQTAATGSGSSGGDSDIFSSEFWAYVDCAKCHTNIVVPNPSNGDPNATAFRSDFTLLGCGHILCNPCLQALSNCPKCDQSIQDGVQVPVSAAQTNPATGQYFRPPVAMLSDVSATLAFQMNLLMDSVSFHKSVSSRQNGVLSVLKAELTDLRDMKKQFDALSRENAALKAQLGGVQPFVANMQPQSDYPARQPRSGRSTPAIQHAAIQHAAIPMQSVRRSGNATPMPQQYQHAQDMMPQQDYQPQAISHAAQLPPRSSMTTPQPRMPNGGYSKSVPPTASRKRSFGVMAGEIPGSAKHRILESMWPQGGISSADHQLHTERQEQTREEEPSSGSMGPDYLRQFMNPKASGPLREQMQPPRSKRVPLNQQLKTIPESASRRQPQNPAQQGAAADEYEEYYDDAIDTAYEQETSGPVRKEHIRQPQHSQTRQNAVFQPAGSYNPDRQPSNGFSAGQKTSTFKALRPKAFDIPTNPNDRSNPPGTHNHTVHNTIAKEGIQPMNAFAGEGHQPIRSPGRARVEGNMQPGQQGTTSRQFGSRQGSQSERQHGRFREGEKQGKQD